MCNTICNFFFFCKTPTHLGCILFGEYEVRDEWCNLILPLSRLPLPKCTRKSTSVHQSVRCRVKCLKNGLNRISPVLSFDVIDEINLNILIFYENTPIRFMIRPH